MRHKVVSWRQLWLLAAALLFAATGYQVVDPIVVEEGR